MLQMLDAQYKMECGLRWILIPICLFCPVFDASISGVGLLDVAEYQYSVITSTIPFKFIFWFVNI